MTAPHRQADCHHLSLPTERHRRERLSPHRSEQVQLLAGREPGEREVFLSADLGHDQCPDPDSDFIPETTHLLPLENP